MNERALTRVQGGLVRAAILTAITINPFFLLAVATPTQTSNSQQVVPVSEQLQQIRHSLAEAKSTNDSASYLRQSRKLYQLLNGSPRSTLQMMLAEITANEQKEALDSFAQYVQMGQTDNQIALSKELDGLRALPAYSALYARMTANQIPRSQSQRVFTLPADAPIPEDIDYDTTNERFYVTSVLGKRVIAIDKSGNAEDFAVAPDGWPMMALKIDRKRRILWATEVAIDGFSSCRPEEWGRSAILVYDLTNRKLLHRIEGPPHTALGDMALTAEGDVIVSDGDHGGVYRVHRHTQRIERLDAGDFNSPQTPVCLPDRRHLIVPDYLRGLGILDLRTKAVSWVPMEGRYALNGIDGLYLSGHTLLATQNGTSPERVIRFVLSPSFGHVKSESIIERATSTLGDPTHGVIVGTNFYYIANSGWETLDEHGDRKPRVNITPALIMRTPVVHTSVH